MVYVSITGLTPLSVWQLPRFWWHAGLAMTQARSAPGNISADAIRGGAVYHTLSVWRDRPAMIAYVSSGAHRKAMAAFPGIGTGFAFGFDAETAPALGAVHDLWLEEAARRAAA